MNMKRKFIGILGALALTATATGGIVSAQSVSDTATIGIQVLCGANNTGPSTVSILENGDTNFEALDPSDSSQLALRTTGERAFRVQVDIDECQTGAWHVDASITDFTSGADVITGTKFQMPIGGTQSSTTATDANGVEVPAVVAPGAGLITFSGTSSPYAGSHAVMSTAGGATGVMYMDFTGQLANLDANTPDGTYSAELTVTFQTGAP